MDEIDVAQIAMPPPRGFTERVRLAIYAARDYHHHADDPSDELGAEFMRHLRGVGLKLVWLDGSEVTQAQLHAKSR